MKARLKKKVQKALKIFEPGSLERCSARHIMNNYNEGMKFAKRFYYHDAYLKMK